VRRLLAAAWIIDDIVLSIHLAFQELSPPREI